mgnify:CR=1 FL=1
MQKFELKCEGYPGHECGKPLSSYLEYPDHVVVMASMLKGYQCKPCARAHAAILPPPVNRNSEIKAIEDGIKDGKMTEREGIVKLLKMFRG